MSLFPKTVKISADKVSAIVLSRWGITLGPIIKASQNHTYSAQRGEEKFAVRVTPDASAKDYDRIVREIFFVRYIAAKGLYHVCAPVESLSGDYLHREEDMDIVVFSWAKGSPLDFLKYRWMTDEQVVTAWGRWLAEFHQLSKAFSIDYPEVAKAIQNFDQVHQGIMKDSPVDLADAAVMDDPNEFGVVHGDLNLSNFFYIDAEQRISAFDWDQTQRGWYMWDVAQSAFTVTMLAEAGSVIDGSPVPAANPEQFHTWFFAGYESVLGPGSIDRQRFRRMLELRKYFYEAFCRKASEQGDVPADMAHFIDYIVAWFDKIRAKKIVEAPGEQQV